MSHQYFEYHDRTLIFYSKSCETAYMVRLCKTLDGKFGYSETKKIDLPWFQVTTIHNPNSIWKFFPIPYICFAKCTYIIDIHSDM